MLAPATRQRRIGRPIHLIIDCPFLNSEIDTNSWTFHTPPCGYRSAALLASTRGGLRQRSVLTRRSVRRQGESTVIGESRLHKLLVINLRQPRSMSIGVARRCGGQGAPLQRSAHRWLSDSENRWTGVKAR